uniref:Dynein heavy chain C-terminal domain-containing protein n=1 Tax=Oncorhynchus tshawytscha TaxID=74940 RepID=A0A8C8CT01_ONCTS
MMGKMLKMQMLEDEDDLTYEKETKRNRKVSTSNEARPAWMRTLRTTATNWLTLIPQVVNHLKQCHTQDPLFCFFEREVKMGTHMLQEVRQDLTDVVQVCEGKKQTNDLMSPPGILPHSWCHYTVPASMTVIQWVADFSEHVKQLQAISQGAASEGAIRSSRYIHLTSILKG